MLEFANETRSRLPVFAAREEVVVREPQHIRVLVVEDDPGDFTLIERALRRMASYEASVTLAGSMQASEFVLSAEEFDLAILDYSLDDGHGTSLIPYLGCPAILMTGLLASQIEHEALTFGAAACLEKEEITPRVMENTVRLALKSAELAARLEAAQRSPVLVALAAECCEGRPQ